MEEKKDKCPLCNKKLVLKDGVPTCPDCGYRDPYRSGSGQSQADYNRQPQMNYGQSQADYNRQPQMNYGQSQANYGQQPKLGPYAAVVEPSKSGKKDKGINPSAVIGIMMIVIVAISGIVTAIGVVSHSFDTSKEAEGDIYGSSDSYWPPASSAVPSAADDPLSSSVSAGSHNSDISHLIFNPPESDLLQEFVSQLFDKPASSVTREELNSVTGVEIRDIYNYNGTELIYELADGTTGNCYLASTRVDTEDFKCFPNLRTLDLGRNSLSWDTDWYNLTSLTSLTCEATLGDLAGYMDVSQLTALELTCDFLMSDCSDIGAYSNLEYLKLDCNDNGMELTGISQATTLKTLVIEDGDGISDYEELYGMTQLKELSIESGALRDIGFISGMSGLESLELANTQLLQISAIWDCADTLKCLRLHQNNSVEDYSPVFECTGLEELELYVDYDINADMEMPDLSMMPGLKVLVLGNYDSFPGLGDLTALENLTLIDGGYFSDAAKLAGVDNLTNLKSLSFIDMSAEPALLEAFAGVASLETIELTDTFIWGDINVVFGMPNLKVLNLENADFGLKLEGMPVSESLLELNMADTKVHQLKEDGSWDYSANNTQIELGGYTEFFDHMPNLTALTVPGQELQNVKFAENLSQLTYLNITNNYVTDLSPLAELDQLKTVICENNPVHDRTGLKNVVIID